MGELCVLCASVVFCIIPPGDESAPRPGCLFVSEACQNGLQAEAGHIAATNAILVTDRTQIHTQRSPVTPRAKPLSRTSSIRPRALLSAAVVSGRPSAGAGR